MEDIRKDAGGLAALRTLDVDGAIFSARLYPSSIVALDMFEHRSPGPAMSDLAASPR